MHLALYFGYTFYKQTIYHLLKLMYWKSVASSYLKELFSNY